MRTSMRTVFTIVLFLTVATHACAGEIGFAFSGFVSVKHSDPWNTSIPNGAPVSGRFIYDTQSSVSHTDETCDCAGYRQQITGGFSADFGSTHIRADDYVVEVSNDFPNQQGFVRDIITVRFSGTYDPALSPINVNGSEFATGEFYLGFVGLDGNRFSATTLPSSIDIVNDYPEFRDANFLSTAYGSLPLLFEVTNLDSFPVATGDYNFDGVVDTADYSVWKSLLSSTTDLSADGNRDGIVDAADFTVWRDAATSVATANVPEPTFSWGWRLLLCGAVLALKRTDHGRG